MAMLRKCYSILIAWSGPLALSAFLLLMRIIWGWGFFAAGKGKLADISRPIGFFRELHIPVPVASAWLVAIVETVGGLLLLAGLGSRAVAIALIINMTVAYLTADNESVRYLFSQSDPSKFFAAAPFWFLVTSVLVFALGPGMFSLDALLKRWGFNEPTDRPGFEVVTPSARR